MTLSRRLLSLLFRMLKNTKNLSSVKEFVKTCADSKVKVNLNLGRNKSITFFGVLSGIYPALFTVKPDEKNFLGRTAYSYSDLLCGTVKIKKIL